MSNTMKIIIAMMADANPVSILMGTNAALGSALVLLYHDCKKDRAKLWAQIRELERRFSGH